MDALEARLELMNRGFRPRRKSEWRANCATISNYEDGIGITLFLEDGKTSGLYSSDPEEIGLMLLAALGEERETPDGGRKKETSRTSALLKGFFRSNIPGIWKEVFTSLLFSALGLAAAFAAFAAMDLPGTGDVLGGLLYFGFVASIAICLVMAVKSVYLVYQEIAEGVENYRELRRVK